MEREIINRLEQIVGTENVLSQMKELTGYSCKVATNLNQLPYVIVKPSSTDEVSQILSLANSKLVPVYPRSSDANLGTGTIPTQDSIVLLMTRMNKIIEIDAANLVAIAEPGITLTDLNNEVEKLGLIYPPDPGTATATLGGTVAQNSGNLRSLKYGVAKHYVMGLEVVLADGRILSTGGKNVKDVAGYDLTKLITGSAGTLGVITKIMVKLVPAPEAKKSILASFNNLSDAGKAAINIVSNMIIPATLEIMDNTTIRAIETYERIDLPSNAEAILLVEVDGIPEVVEMDSFKVIEELKASKATEISVAQNDAERDKIWAARRAALPAMASLRPNCLVVDVTVPHSKISDILRTVKQIAAKYGLTIGILGHVGDGNLHPIIAYDHHNQEEMEQVYQAIDEIFLATLNLGGTLSSGLSGNPENLKYIEKQTGSAGLATMRAIKQSLDPNGILNPGKNFGE